MNGYTVKRIPGGQGRDFIREHHYSKGCHNGPMTWGLFDGDTLIGVCAFATPNSEAVRSSVFGEEHKARVTELHRLVVLDGTPTNTESWFISQALRGLHAEKPEIVGVLSFADGTEGHRGVIYQATNAIYLGTTGRHRFYRDQEGRLRHPRQNGHNVTLQEAAERGWAPEMRDAKHRYLYILGSTRRRKHWRAKIKGTKQPYPKEDN